MKSHGTQNKVINLIRDRLVSFGPNRVGPNVLLNFLMSSEESLQNRLRKICDIDLVINEMPQDEAQ